MTSLSVIVPVWNERELACACLQSVARAVAQLELDHELIVVDDDSSDGARESIAQQFPAARLLVNDRNRGFAHAANRGMAQARGELLLLLNSDTELEAQDLKRMLEFLREHAPYAGVAPRLVDRTGATRHELMALPDLATALMFGTPFERWFPDSVELRRYFQRDLDPERDADVVQPPAAAWLLRRAAWQSVGEFDESLELFFNDVDWCRRLRASAGRLRYLASASVLHHGGASTRRRADFVSRWQTDRLRYYRKHFGRPGGVWVKACVSFSFTDWWVRNAWRRMLGGSAEPAGPTSRAFAAFLRA